MVRVVVHLKMGSGPTHIGGTSTQASFPGAISYGNAGGDSPDESGGGGGGGASAAGQTTAGMATGGYGGAGKEFSSFGAYGTDSSNTTGATPGSGSGKGYFAGGGGGGGYPPPQNSGGAGGVGGGGRGGRYNPNRSSEAGFANTGGGGGGKAHDGSSASAGGTGIILLKTAAATTNMTIASNTQTAQSTPTTGRLMLYEQDVDAVTLNTDIKGYVSRDNGTTYTQTTLALDSNITHPTSLLLHCDGANDGTVFTDSSFWTNQTTVGGNTHTDTAVKKMGTASAQFDGTGDYLDYASSPAFGFGTGDWTIDFWIYASASGFGTFAFAFDFRTDGNSAGSPYMFFDTGNSNVPGFTDGSGTTRCSSNVAMSNETWYHIAVVKSSNVTKVYTDGVTGASGTYATEFADTVDYKTTNPLRLGHTTSGSYAFKWLSR